MDSENARLARRWFVEVWNDRNEATIEELLTPQSHCHTDGGGLITGPDEFRTVMFEPFVTAFPDLSVTIDDIIAEGAKAVVRWTAHATHTGIRLSAHGENGVDVRHDVADCSRRKARRGLAKVQHSRGAAVDLFVVVVTARGWMFQIWFGCHGHTVCGVAVSSMKA